MAQNTGTLISAPIRPNDTLDLIASAYASELKGGLHVATSSTDRNSIILQRRDWGMMCYVINDNQTYQLEYGYSSTNILDNSNWVVFSGSGGGGGGATEWLPSVLSIENTEPVTPTNGDRYIIGNTPTGVIWSTLFPGTVVQYDSAISNWVLTNPTENTSVRVDNEDNAIYRYEGVFPTGSWEKEKESQVRYINATTIDGFSYSATSTPQLSGYNSEILFITKFGSTNLGPTASLDVNGLGGVQIKKASGQSLTNLAPNDLSINYPYALTYDGTYFVIVKPSSDNVSFNVQYNIPLTEDVTVPQNTQYWVYGDLNIEGDLDNAGRVIVTNGGLTIGPTGSLSIGGELILNYFAEIDGLAQTNYIPRWKTNYILSATSSLYDDGETVQVTGNTFSVNTQNIYIPNGAASGYVLTSDANGVATWQIPLGTKYSATQSFSAGVTYSITHNLNTKDIVFSLWDDITGENLIMNTVRTSDNTVDLNSAVALPSVRIVILGS